MEAEFVKQKTRLGLFDVVFGERPGARPIQNANRGRFLHWRLKGGSFIYIVREADMDVYEVEKILDVRQHKGRPQYLVRWKNYPPSEDTWEPAKNLKACEDAVKAFYSSRMLSSQGQTESTTSYEAEVATTAHIVNSLSRNIISQQLQEPKPQFLPKLPLSMRPENTSISSEGTSAYVSHTVKPLLKNEDDDIDDCVNISAPKMTKGKILEENISKSSRMKDSHFKEYYVTECLKRCWLLIVLYVLTFALMIWYTDLPSRIPIFGTDAERTPLEGQVKSEM